MILIQSVDDLHIFFGKGELHHGKVFGKVVGFATGDGDETPLHNLSKYNLWNRLLIRFHDFPCEFHAVFHRPMNQQEIEIGCL